MNDESKPFDYNDFFAWIGRFCPIDGCILYRNGAAIVKRSWPNNNRLMGARGDRMPITELSEKSRKQLAFTAMATDAKFDTLMTLTYGRVYPVDGSEVKTHLGRFLKWLRGYGSESYLWFLEFQQRGAPHFHLMTDLPAPLDHDRVNMAYAWLKSQGFDLAKSKLSWAKQHDGWYKTDQSPIDKVVLDNYKFTVHEKSWEAIRERDGAIRYALKYAMKPTQKIVPPDYSNVGRFWGASKAVYEGIRPVDEWDLTEDTLRQIMKDAGSWFSDKPFIPKIILDLKILDDYNL